MMLCYDSLRQFPEAFARLTGLDVVAFDDLLTTIAPRYAEVQLHRKSQIHRRRAIGGGGQMELTVQDQLIVTLIWLHHFPKQNVLGLFFGISQPTVWRYIECIKPLLPNVSTVRLTCPAPSRKKHLTLAELLTEVPELITIIEYYLIQFQEAQKIGSLGISGSFFESV